MYEAQTKFTESKVVRERYIIDELLGKGGFGAVYRVRDRRVRNNVFALKEIVDPNKYQYARFTFESKLLQRLDHPHLPRVYRTFTDEKLHRLYMLMDYVDGPNMERLRVRQSERRFSFAQTLQLMTPIIEAVVYLHAQTPPIIHRDIKPANIIVPASGEGAVLVDFGIAKEYDLNATTTAIRHCSPGYGAPEQYICDTNPRTDIYGLGATFYTLLTGEVPIDSLYRMTSLSGKGTDPLIPINTLAPEIPIPVIDIVQHALAINSAERFISVEAFWEALKECVSEKMTDPLLLEVSPELSGRSLWKEASDMLLSANKPMELVSTYKLHSSTGKGVTGRSVGLLPTAPVHGNLRQPEQIIDTRRETFLMRLFSLIILALSAGAILAAGLQFGRRFQGRKGANA